LGIESLLSLCGFAKRNDTGYISASLREHQGVELRANRSERHPALLRVSLAQVFESDCIVPIEILDDGEIDTVLADVLATLRIVPYIYVAT
jgi:hypothetical protein